MTASLLYRIASVLLALFALGLLAGGLAPSMIVLVAARAIQGIGAGAIPAVAYVAVGRAYPTASQPRMFAVMSSAWRLICFRPSTRRLTGTRCRQF